MPDISFVLPHWLYWSMVLIVPIVIMALVIRHQQQKQNTTQSAFIAYFFLLTGGFMGLHRLYLRSAFAVIYIVAFIFILESNTLYDSYRIQVSEANSKILKAEFLAERAEKNGDAEKQQQFLQELSQHQANHQQALAAQNLWRSWASYIFYAICVFIIFDIYWIRRKINKTQQDQPDDQPDDQPIDDDDQLAGIFNEGDITKVYAKASPPNFENPLITRFVRMVDTLNHYVGQYIASWTVIAVMVFYYEVIVRYAFNSPTNWAHESMFLLLGMQYLYAGGFALKEGSHVRVDVLYMNLSDKTKALFDVMSPRCSSLSSRYH